MLRRNVEVASEMKHVAQFFSGCKKGMSHFGEFISVIVNTILLFFVYILGIGITSVIAKLCKKKFLDMSLSKKEKSYWVPLNLKEKKMEEYFRQF